MGSLSSMSDVLALGDIGNDSNKTAAVLDALQLVKINSRETPKPGITVVELTSKQSIWSHKK